jgi:phosphoenolpyruvate synthase/pyruvate phosphate dikinase
MKKYGLDTFIAKMLDSAEFWSDASLRAKILLELQDSIEHSPVDTELLKLVNNALSNSQGITNFRFRSSSNTEDLEGFNGAGLYDSYTGIIGDKNKTIEKAIRKTWASLWNLRAFEEREYFKIDQKSVAMGELVERAFPTEAANGVVVTKNLFNQYNAAYTINVQVGEISIVLPTDNYLPDQILFYLSDPTDNTIEYVSHSTVPGMEAKTVMTIEELKELKKYCNAISNHYCALNFECKTMDIEFKVDLVNGKRKLYIKQARVY